MSQQVSKKWAPKIHRDTEYFYIYYLTSGMRRENDCYNKNH